MYAAPATSASVMPLSGEPRTWNLPPASSMSSGAASSRWATSRLALSATLTAERARRRAPPPAGGRRGGAVGARALRAGRRVAVDHLDLRGVDAQTVGDD